MYWFTKSSTVLRFSTTLSPLILPFSTLQSKLHTNLQSKFRFLTKELDDHLRGDTFEDVSPAEEMVMASPLRKSKKKVAVGKRTSLSFAEPAKKVCGGPSLHPSWPHIRPLLVVAFIVQRKRSENGKSEKGGRAEGQPKKPRTAFLWFSTTYSKEHPDLKFLEVSSILPPRSCSLAPVLSAQSWVRVRGVFVSVPCVQATKQASEKWNAMGEAEKQVGLMLHQPYYAVLGKFEVYLEGMRVSCSASYTCFCKECAVLLFFQKETTSRNVPIFLHLIFVSHTGMEYEV